MFQCKNGFITLSVSVASRVQGKSKDKTFSDDIFVNGILVWPRSTTVISYATLGSIKYIYIIL